MSKVTGIIGPRGSGKSTYASDLVRQTGEPVLIFDPNHERIWSECADELVIASPKLLGESLRQGGVTVYRPGPFSEEGEAEESPLTWPVNLAYLLGNCTLVIDEAHFFCSAGYMPRVLKIAIRSGRHRNLSIIYITQSWAAVSRAITANTEEFVFFHIIEPRDLAGIRERCGAWQEEQVRRLHNHEHVVWNASIPAMTEGMLFNESADDKEDES